MAQYLTVSGAYGRDYASRAKVLADWFADRDFVVRGLQGGSYINRADAVAQGITVTIRYKRDTRSCTVKPTDTTLKIVRARGEGR